MSEEIEQAPEDRCGVRLKRAREALNIPISTISKELHLDETKVEALERNEFDVLGAAVFAKGHLRKYSQMVKVDTDQILLDYHQLTQSDGLPPVVSNRQRPSSPKSPAPWIIGGILILLLAAAWFGWQFFIAQKDGRIVAPPTAPIAATDRLELPGQNPAADLQEKAEVVETLVEAIAEPLVSDETASNQISLQLVFSGDCWTEVTDADGDRLFFSLGTAGDEISVRGDTPVSVLLGNAENARVIVDGRDYTIAADDRNGETARFTLYGS